MDVARGDRESDGDRDPAVADELGRGSRHSLDSTHATREIAIEFPERDPAELDDATELYLMDQHAASDGTVTAQVLGWEREGDAVRVDYALPTGERRTDRYRWPTPGRYDDSDFLRLVRGLGYTPGTAEHVAGEFARARRENGRWRLVTGRQWDAERGGGGGRGGRDGEDLNGTEGDARPESRVAAGLPDGPVRRLARAEPMDLATVSVGLFLAAVFVPVALALVGDGLAGWMVALGAFLYVAAGVAVWLALAALDGGLTE